MIEELQALAQIQKQTQGYPYYPPFTFVELPDESLGFISGMGKWGLYTVKTIKDGKIIEKEVFKFEPLTEEDLEEME